jgi:multidrug efflux system outer membrane protein
MGAWAWTEVYRDPVLTNLIVTALANNQDLRIAAARVEEAFGQAGVQRAALFPASTARPATAPRGRATFRPCPAPSRSNTTSPAGSPTSWTSGAGCAA